MMIKRMTLLVRKEELSFAQFRDYWHEHHARIVERMPMVAGYVQNPVIERPSNDTGDSLAFTFDGIVELWFRDEGAKIAAFNSPAAKLLPEDEPNFIRGITIFSIEEKELKPGKGDAKAMLVGRTGPDPFGVLSAYGQIENCVASLSGLRRVVANRVLSVDWRAHLWHEPNPPDLIVELRFENVTAARAALTWSRFASLENEFKSRGGALVTQLVEERRVI